MHKNRGQVTSSCDFDQIRPTLIQSQAEQRKVWQRAWICVGQFPGMDDIRSRLEAAQDSAGQDRQCGAGQGQGMTMAWPGQRRWVQDGARI